MERNRLELALRASEREAVMEVITIISIIASHFRRVSSPFASEHYTSSHILCEKKRAEKVHTNERRT